MLDHACIFNNLLAACAFAIFFCLDVVSASVWTVDVVSASLWTKKYGKTACKTRGSTVTVEKKLTSANMAALLEAGHEASAPIEKQRMPYCGMSLSRLPGTPVAYFEQPAFAALAISSQVLHCGIAMSC